MPARDEEEDPSQLSPAYREMREWRKSERKKMSEELEELIAVARKRAKSQYTRSTERSKWTRLAGQLIWYKDQILRAMA